MDITSYLLGKKAGGGSPTPTPTKYAPRVPFQMQQMFYNYKGTDLTYEIENIDTTNCVSFANCFQNCSNMTELDLSSWNTTNAVYMDNMFSSCSNLTSLDLSNFTSDSTTVANYMFYVCIKLRKIDMRNFDFTKLTSINYMFGGANVNNRVPYGCEIIVKDATQKEWFATNFSSYTNVKTASEYEG